MGDVELDYKRTFATKVLQIDDSLTFPIQIKPIKIRGFRVVKIAWSPVSTPDFSNNPSIMWLECKELASPLSQSSFGVLERDIISTWTTAAGPFSSLYAPGKPSFQHLPNPTEITKLSLSLWTNLGPLPITTEMAVFVVIEFLVVISEPNMSRITPMSFYGPDTDYDVYAQSKAIDIPRMTGEGRYGVGRTTF